MRIESRSKIEAYQFLSFMKLESISIAGKDTNNQALGKRF